MWKTAALRAAEVEGEGAGQEADLICWALVLKQGASRLKPGRVTVHKVAEPTCEYGKNQDLSTSRGKINESENSVGLSGVG